MYEKYLITIIMPIYNSETYLPNTINSIINQSIGFENIELILIDDKSTDNSKFIIEKYASKYNNIIPIYLENNSGYPGFVRNKGLEKSTSKYIMFIDSDDEYEVDMCETLYTIITENDCDCVESNFRFFDYLSKEENQKLNTSYEKTFLNPIDALYTSQLVIWNKIFKKSILDSNNIKFVTDKIGEDGYFCIEYLINSKSMIFLEKYFGYKYFNREKSFTTSNLEWNLKVIKQHYEYLDFLNQKQIKLNMPLFFQNAIICSISLVINIEENDYKSVFQVLKELYYFEKKIDFTMERGSLIFRFINKFIENNHISIATRIILVMNRIYNMKFIMKIYRQLLNIF